VQPQPFSGNVEAEVTPREGVINLLELMGAWAGSIGRGTDYLGPTTRVETLELNQWFRFDKPGHFALTLKSHAVQRRRSVDEGGGLEQLTLEMEPLQFDILPEDPAWESTELEEIERILEQAPAESAERMGAMHRLSLLDSPRAARKLTEIYFARGPADSGGEAYRGLNNSRHADLVIALLKEGMSDPTRNPHAIGADLLAELETRKEIGVIPPRRDDPEGQKEWEEKLAQRNKTYNEFFSRANALIVASLKERTGKARAEATYEAWNNAERQSPRAETTGVERLREEVLQISSDLEIGEQLNFVSATWGWGTIPHEQLRPLIARAIASEGDQAAAVRHRGYEFLCQDWSKDCAMEILAAAQQPGTKIWESSLLLLPEAEHLELDAMLEAELPSGASVRQADFNASQRIATLLLRAGSRNLLKTVQGFLDQQRAKPTIGCETRAKLVGYLFRFAPQDAAKRTLAETLDEKSACGGEILQSLQRERYSEELIPVAVKTLDSSNGRAASAAARLLARHGAAADEEKVKALLEKLRKTWGERAAEIQSAGTGWMGPDAVNQAARAAAELEQSLASALMEATAWKLSDEEREELRVGCLTDNCREIAEGRMTMGF
jgi:hypothetical protein